jgi:probable DNA repair protein
VQGVPTGLLDSLRAGHTVLAPNAELARALFEAVERTHRDQGGRCWPTPRVQDFSSWLRAQHARRQLPEPGADRALGSGAAALRALNEVEEQELWRRVVAESELAAHFLEPAGAAAAARRARRIMAEYGIPVAALAAHASDEANALAEWIARFDAKCRALGCIGSDSLLASFAASPEPIAWIESPHWTPLARRWLTQHARGQVAPRQAAAAACRIVHAANPDLELAAMADWSLRRLQADSSFRAWLCVPDLSARRAEVGDAFDATLAPQRYDLPVVRGRAAYAMAGGPALAELSPVRAALEFLQVAVGTVSFARFSALLRAPEYQATAADMARAAALDLALRRVAPSELPLSDWLALASEHARGLSADPPAALGHLELALTRLTELRGQQLPSRWVRVWAQAFEAGPWVHRQRWSSDEYQAAERLRELWSTLAAADHVLGSQSRQAVDRLLMTAARDTPFQAQTGIPPIWISGTVMDPWLGYDALWIAGVSEERWPAPAAPVPLLPIVLQREFGVPTASPEMQIQAARDLQTRWRARAPAVVFSFAAANATRSAVASPLLPSPAESPETFGDGRPASQPHWLRARRTVPSLERIVDERGPRFAPPERTRGVDSLRTQSLCAFRGFATTRLRSEELRMPMPGFSPAERGELVHGALQTVWNALGSSAALASIEPEALTALVTAAVAAALASVCRVRDPGLRWQLREQVRLRALVEQWLDLERRRLPFAIERLESDRVVARYAGLEFNCRVDRVDRLEDGARIVIDYKTGLLAADWRGERPLNPQLPIYALLNPQDLVAVAYGQVNIGQCRFVAESERDALFGPKSKATPLEDCRDFTELLRLWAQRVERLAQNLRDGDAQVAPLAQACSTCHLQGLCRIATTPSDAEAANE